MGDCGKLSMQQQHQPSRHSFTLQRQYGGGPKMAQQVVAKTPPPPTTRDPEAAAAKEDALRQARMRNGRRATILAGAAESQRNAGMGASQSGSGVRNPVLGS
jgi:hypothetical protein